MVFTDGAGNSYTQEKNAFAELTGETNRLGDEQTYTWDAEGRHTNTTAFSGKATRISYNDSAGSVTTRYADGKSSVIMKDMKSNVVRAEGESGIITYQYDAGGKLTKQTDEAIGEATTYTYNSAGLRTTMQSNGRNVSYAYGKKGELLTVNDSIQGLSVSYQYDAMGRETKRSYGNGVVQETIRDTIGRTVLIRERNARSYLSRVEAYVYDVEGRRTFSVDDTGSVTKYIYDNQSRLQTVLYPFSAELMEAARKEASESGIVYMENQAGPERYMLTSVEMNALRNALNYANTNLGSRLSVGQNIWRETYGYDTRGNRTAKTTGWGTIRYSYDKENRLTQKGSIAYTYDKDGNLLTETGIYKEASYTYNGQNRMASSMVYNKAANSRSTTGYTYDAYGRRTVSEDANPANRAMGSAQAVRTLYDAFTFDVLQEGQLTSRGGFNEYYTIPDASSGGTEGGITDPNAVSGLRYQYVGDGSYTSATERTRNTNTGPASPSRYTGSSVSLYAQGEAVAVSYTSSGTNRGGVSYLGKDILGSVKASYDSYGVLEERYEYDAFGTPYKGDLSGGMNYGYTGKPWDATTGLYDYGYRDYSPSVARFTTVDPVRDGSNWFSYVNNDPVNWVDLWGLSASDKSTEEYKSEFDKFMKFLKEQGVERDDLSDPFLYEKIADEWSDLPDSVRNYEPDSEWGKFTDDKGNHDKNQRLPGGYHIATEEEGGDVYVHHDVSDPTKGFGDWISHVIGEVIPQPNTKPNPKTDDKHPDWGE